MKKLFPFIIVAIFGFLLISCERTEYVDNSVPTDYPAVYDLKNVSFSYNQDLGWHYGQSFNKPLLDQDYVIIFRQSGTSNNSPVWQQIPATIYPYNNNLEFNYDFDFSKNDFMIYAGGNYDITTTPQYMNNQTYRVVLVPAVFGKNANAGDLSKMSYEEVIAKYNIDDSKVGTF
ncbi:MAG: hypothetical protein DI529_01975 [Chryseobacterium sp.]|nr:MAG: hypothetical protein DI529_01975 [Chryseobacterium sp.]